ncbi:glycosyl hydrolase family 8 [Micromonospora sp. CP22]|uniref:glycosyl hydrolase family 8 n=1 Tax=Micromonospora sp. CP22 TaxID=2580517 RepID=UPI0012BB64DF|nr:glycosyl hydrolase family 8 [Micromonospora sp. CP22]MTK05427.1 carbohydrate-binding protein [Micromonospora sp. CP22]
MAIPLTAAPAKAATLLTTVQAEAMTNGGGCTALQDTRAVYYCNNDSTYTSYAFNQAGRYSIRIVGASSANNTAGINVLVGGERIAALTFTGTSYTTQSATFDIANRGAKEIRLRLETDNGQNDTYVDYFELYYEGATPPPPPAPNPPSTGAFASGVYRNLFQEWGPTITNAAITAKLNAYWTHFFTGTDDTKRLYYTAGSNSNGTLAYIKDTGNDDVRSEGMSYAMMIAVQMNRKAEFDALWNWAKTYMQHKTGPRTGYFCWQANFSGSCRDNNPASDGEEYFATALFFAGHRWGNGTGIYRYTTEANAILDTMLHKEDMNGGEIESVTNMFNRTEKMIVFVPYASASTFTDPSYHLPAFYELWARWATGWNGNQAADRQFWRDAATRSRRFFTQATHPTTGLNPDYAEFNGTPNNTGNHGDFRFDAWRTSVNWAVDYSWWAADASSKTLTDRMQTFFESQGTNAYVNQYSLAGNPLSNDRSPGLIASNGAASLSATNARAWKFVEALWNLQPPTGQYRYYDGLLTFMGLLHASGNFRIHQPGGGVADTQAPTAPGSLSSPSKSSTSVTLSWSASSDNVGVTGYTAYQGAATSGATGCTNVTTTTCTVTGLSPSTAYSFTVKARDAAGNTSAASSGVSVTTNPPSTTAPAAPSNLTATAGTGQITLSWRDNSEDETGFVIERRTDTGSWSQIATTGAGTASYSDTSVTAGTRYIYRVRARNQAGDSAWSTEATAAASGTGNRNAYQQIEAESFDTGSGVTTSSVDGGTVVDFSGSGSYVVLNNVDFGSSGAGRVQFRVATTSPGVNIQVRVASTSASPACTVYPDGNGTWHLKTNSCYPKLTGTRNIYITTTGAARINHLTFGS